MQITKTSLWTLVISPAVWSVHMMFCYILAAVWCAKSGREADLNVVRIGMSLVTIIALIVVIAQAWKSFRRHSDGEGALPHDDNTLEDQERFLGFLNFLISCLSAFGIIFIAFNGIIFRSCE